MFTGIITEVGRVKKMTRGAKDCGLTIMAAQVTNGLNCGDSIAVNGVCLTVTDLGKDFFSADVMHETLNKTTLGELHCGSLVNLERALEVTGRFDGHFVTGHIDGTGKIISSRNDGRSSRYEIEYSSDEGPVIVKKGPITVDGISLTVVAVTKRRFSIAVIPHTLTHTTLKDKRIGDRVNLEFDMIGKYIVNYLNRGQEWKR